MSEPTPLRRGTDDRLPREVLALLEAAKAPPPAWSEADAARLYRRIEGTVANQRRNTRLRGVALAVALAAAAVFLMLAPWRSQAPPPSTVWSTLSLGEAGTLRVTGDTVVRRDETGADDPEELRVYVLAGVARAAITHRDPARPFVLITPHVRVQVVGTRFGVEVDAGRTRVSVSEGRVQVGSAQGGLVVLSAGDSIASDDLRLGSPRPAPPPVPGSGHADGPLPSPQATDVDCRERALSARRTCLERLAAGEGVPAQNALYALGLLEREHGRTAAALAAWRAYERRFAAGLLAPEVSLAILRSLLDDKRYAAALARAEAFEQRFAGDTRRPEVALIRAKLLCLRFGRLDQAQAAFDVALVAKTSSVRQDALYARAHCLQLLAGEAAARQAWRAYREAFPDAPRGRSVESQVAP